MTGDKILSCETPRLLLQSQLSPDGRADGDRKSSFEPVDELDLEVHVQRGLGHRGVDSYLLSLGLLSEFDLLLFRQLIAATPVYK